MASVPTELKNKPFTLVASLSANEGKGDRLIELLKPVVACANSSKEPGCKTYRLNASADKKTFAVFEEYVNEDALNNHREQEAYKALMAAAKQENLLANFEVKFFEEVKPSGGANL